MGLLIPRLIDPLDSVPEWLPPLLLAVVVVLLSWLWLRDGVIRRVAAVVVALIFLLSTAHWLNGEAIIFASTFLMAGFGFWRTYKTVDLIRQSRKPAPLANPNDATRFDLPFPILWEQILIPFTVVAFGVSLLFARPGKPFFTCPIPYVGGVFDPARWGKSNFLSALMFGVLVGAMRLLTFALIDFRDRSQKQKWKGSSRSATRLRRLPRGLWRGRRWRA